MSISIRYSAVTVATVAGFVVGLLWYGPVFGQQWAVLSAIVPTPEEQATIPLTALLTLISKAPLAFAIAVLTSAFRVLNPAGTSWRAGLMAAALVWLCVVIPVTAFYPLWARVPASVWLFTAADWLVVTAVMGTIIGVMKPKAVAGTSAMVERAR